MYKRRLRIFDHYWSADYHEDLANTLKGSCDFFICLTTRQRWNETSQFRSNNVPENVKFVVSYKPGDYDIAILHINQLAMIPLHQNRIIYDELNELITDIPKIVVNHGTPVSYDDYTKRTTEECERLKNICVDTIRQIVGRNTMVVHSYTASAQREWGFGTPIIRGWDSRKWPHMPKEPRVFTAVPPAGLDAYYNRSCLREVDRNLALRGYKLWHFDKNLSGIHSNQTYKEFLGRSLLYFDPSIRTPLNKARTEAFLSGCCVVQVDGAHDLELWARHGENIVIVPDDPVEISKIIIDYLDNKYGRAIEIGQEGRRMAISEFTIEKYERKWLRIISEVLKFGK